MGSPSTPRTDFIRKEQLLDWTLRMKYYVILYVTLVGNALASPISTTLGTTTRAPCHCKSVLNQTHTSAVECRFLPSADDWRNQACYSETFGDLSSLKSLTIKNSYFNIITTSSLASLKNLEVLSITENKAFQRIEQLPYLPALHTLNLANNSLTELAPQSFANLPNLKNLSLANNSLTILNGKEWEDVLKLKALYLAGESLKCIRSLEWLLKYDDILKDANSTYCTVNYDDETQSDYDDLKYPLIKLLRAIEAINNSCPDACQCRFKRTYMDGSTLKYEVNVNCDSQKLTKLPDTLPKFTTDLNVNNNEITDLKIVEINPHYAFLKALRVANNNLTSLQSLANGDFLKRYQYLDVSGNPIKPTELPLDALGEGNAKKAINETNQGKALVLYNIMWPCDCYMAEKLTPWILANFGILGANGKGEARSLLCVREGKMVMIAQLVKDLECPKPKEEWDSVYTNYAIVAVECVLLLVLLLKITYDTWMYFRTGKLPWIATKIP